MALLKRKTDERTQHHKCSSRMLWKICPVLYKSGKFKSRLVQTLLISSSNVCTIQERCLLDCSLFVLVKIVRWFSQLWIFGIKSFIMYLKWICLIFCALYDRCYLDRTVLLCLLLTNSSSFFSRCWGISSSIFSFSSSLGGLERSNSLSSTNFPIDFTN